MSDTENIFIISNINISKLNKILHIFTNIHKYFLVTFKNISNNIQNLIKFRDINNIFEIITIFSPSIISCLSKK